MTIDADFYVQSIVSLFVITSVVDPVKILVFNQAIADPARRRAAAAGQVALYVLVVLCGSALVGKQLLELMGIDLNAFTAVGGFLIMSMGLEMLYGGQASRAQGEKQREEGPQEGDSLLVPLTIPLIAGPGAITTSITIASTNDSWEAVLVAVIAAAVVAAAAFVTFSWLAGTFERAKPTTVALLARVGGLLLATIGAQMMFNGLKNFFA